MFRVLEGMQFKHNETGKVWWVVKADKDRQRAELHSVEDDINQMECWDVTFTEIKKNFTKVKCGTSEIQIGEIWQARADAENAIFEAVKKLEELSVHVEVINLNRMFTVGKRLPMLSSVDVKLILK